MYSLGILSPYPSSLPPSPVVPVMNCLMILEIFSDRCMSVWAVWEVTKKVAFSKSTTLRREGGREGEREGGKGIGKEVSGNPTRI
jgi:hypothetical protein